MSRNQQTSMFAVNQIAEEIFHRRLEQFRNERQRIQKKGIPLSENLMKINSLVEMHLKDLNAAMAIFRRTNYNML